MITGHKDGVITLNASDADASPRFARAEALGESDRTLVGHMRHEIPFFLHFRQKHAPDFIQGFGTAFGAERADPYRTDDITGLLDRSAAQAQALYHISRSMGLADLYPLTLTGPVRDNLAFIHRHPRRA